METCKDLRHPEHWKLDNGLRKYRVMVGYSQYDVANMTNLSQRLISAYELGEISPPLDHLRIFARCYGVTVPDLTETDSIPFAHRRAGTSINANRRDAQLRRRARR